MLALLDLILGWWIWGLLCSLTVNGITARGGFGGQSAPDAFHQEIFADPSGKERQGKRENGEENKEYCKREEGKVENLKWKGKKYEN